MCCGFSCALDLGYGCIRAWWFEDYKLHDDGLRFLNLNYKAKMLKKGEKLVPGAYLIVIRMRYGFDNLNAYVCLKIL